MKYTILVENMKKVRNKITAFNKKAVIYGCEQIVYDISDVYEKKLDKSDESSEKFLAVEVVDFTFKNSVYKIKGWSLLASVENTENGNIIVKINNEVDIPERFHNLGCICEHCNTQRRRKKLFLVHNEENNEIKQVGSSCLTDYLGFDATIFISYFKLERYLHESVLNIYNSISPIPIISTKYFLNQVIYNVDNYGYVSQKMVNENNSYGESTGHFVFNEIKNKNIYKVDNYKTIDNIYEWLDNLEADNDYIRNIKIICKNEFTSLKTSNLTASIYKSYLNSLKNKKKVNQYISDHFGNKKDRLSTELKLDDVFSLGSFYGTCFLHIFHTIDNKKAIWITNKNDLEIGKIYEGKVTIKDHNEYEGIKQTVLTRCILKEKIRR